MANKIHAGRSFLALWFLICAPLCHAALKFDGAWQGTYNSLHYDRHPEGGSPLEQINEFELRLRERRGTVTGEFTRRTPAAQGVARDGRWLSILNGKVFGDRACFDVVDDDLDMRWCITLHGNKLSGTWSGGPEGGPILGGAGAGVRFYKVSGHKVAR